MATALIYQIPEKAKICKGCGKLLPADAFHTCKTQLSGLQYYCKRCARTHYNEYVHRAGLHKDSLIDKEGSLYLGVHVGEVQFAMMFPNAVAAPSMNRGYDFVCPSGKRVDVKSSCLRTTEGYVRKKWRFNIRRNVDADYFACFGFDDRSTCNPMRCWIIPTRVVGVISTLDIPNNSFGITKWKQYEQQILEEGGIDAN